MPPPTDLPRALPLAIAAGLLALVLAPWLGSADDGCAARAETVSSVSNRTSVTQVSTSTGTECR